MTLKSTRPMILQSFEDEFDLPSRRTLKIPSPDGDILVKVSLMKQCLRNIIKYTDLELGSCCT